MRFYKVRPHVPAESLVRLLGVRFTDSSAVSGGHRVWQHQTSQRVASLTGDAGVCDGGPMKSPDCPRPKVYVAGASAPSEILKVEHWSERLVSAGADVVSTWVANVRKEGSGNPRTAQTVDRRTWSGTDLAEVTSAQLYWLLVPPPEVPTRGAWVEVGWAYALAKVIVFSGDTRQSIFCALGDEYEEHETAFGAVLLRLGLEVVA